MPRSIDQIMKELDSYFAPTRKVISQQQRLIPQQIGAAEKGLETRKDNEFRDITARANRRGVFYSGAPIQEEQRYTGEQFLPALANLRLQGQEQKLSLAQALANTAKEQGLLAQQVRAGELDREEARRAAARAAAAAQSSTSGISNLLGSLFSGGGSTGGQTQGVNLANAKINVRGADKKTLQSAFDDVQSRVEAFQSNQLSRDALRSDFTATAASAKYGNLRDLAKLQIYRALRPDLFKAVYSWEKTGGQPQVRNLNQLSF